jgi:17beta-estradiol 17-dehydrogenase / very-long-chain 3-oxoacyl-CoA reductase
LNLSSAASTAVYAGSAHYAATKTFDDFLSLTIAQEYGSKVDVLTARPFIVTTPMTRNIDSPIHCSARKAAEAFVRQLPRGGVSYGPLIHRLQGALVELIGGKIAGWVMGQAVKQFEIEYNKRA